MKAAAIRYLNEIVSLTVLTLMILALVAGQADASLHGADVARESTYPRIRHNGE
jgi:ABC-type amino acid transport substrate-binding protein